MFFKKVGSFALISGTLGSFACQSVSGVQGDLQKKASVVNAGKQNLVSKQNERKSVDKNVVEKSILQKGSAVSEQNKKQVKSILFGEYSDLLLNYLSKAFGVHEHWKSLFETYEGDPYKAAKYGFVVLLLLVRGWYAFEIICDIVFSYLRHNVKKIASFEDTWGALFSSENNLARERTLFNLYAYNCSLPALVLRALCPTVSLPAFVLRIKSSIFSEDKIISFKRSYQKYKKELETLKNWDENDEYKINLKADLEDTKNKLLALGVNVADM